MNSLTKCLALSGLGIRIGLLISMVQTHAVVISNATFTYSNSDRMIGLLHDSKKFDITNVSVNQDAFNNVSEIIGLIENIDPTVIVDEVKIMIQLYDKDNRLIRVAEGSPQ